MELCSILNETNKQTKKTGKHQTNNKKIKMETKHETPLNIMIVANVYI